MARLYDSTTDRITLGTTALPTTGSISMWFYPNWVKTDGVSHEWFNAHMAEPSPGSFRLLKFSNGNFFGGWYTNAEYRVVVASSGYTLNQSAWNHLAFTWDDSANVSVGYMNGSTIGSTSTLVTFTTSHTKCIGNQVAEGAEDINFDGRIAEFALWNVALNSSEAAALQKGLSAALVRPQSLVHYIPLVREVIDLKGQTLTDTSTAVIEHPRIIYPTQPRYGIPGVVTLAEQEGYRWRDDDGDEDAASWLAAQDSDITAAAAENVRLRILTNMTGDQPSQALRLQYRKVGETDWQDVQ